MNHYRQICLNEHVIMGPLVIELKNYCLKRCENCGLKNVVEKCVFRIYKTKKNVFGIIV